MVVHGGTDEDFFHLTWFVGAYFCAAVAVVCALQWFVRDARCGGGCCC
jgi:hypothetical protein